MSCFFLLHEYGHRIDHIPDFDLKTGVVLDLALGCLFSVVLGVMGVVAGVISLCITAYYCSKAIKPHFFLNKEQLSNTLLDTNFLLEKIVEIFLLLIPVFGFLGLFFYKVYCDSGSVWSRCFRSNVSIYKIPYQMYNANLNLSHWLLKI